MPTTYTDGAGVAHVVNPVYCVGSSCASAPGGPGYAVTDLGEVLITPVAATSPTIPATATYCTFQAQNGTINVRGDGTFATTSTGTQIYSGGTLSANGRAYAVGLSFIQQAGSGTIWQACYK
jgi:hypothetical protein